MTDALYSSKGAKSVLVGPKIHWFLYLRSLCLFERMGRLINVAGLSNVAERKSHSCFIFADRMRFIVLFFLFFFTGGFVEAFAPAVPWGFYGHKKINRQAVFILPEGMIGFFKKHIDYLSSHSTDADKRRKLVEGEAEKHFIDLDHYGKDPFAVIPKKWKDAVQKYSEDTLKEYGILPWNIEGMMYQLTEAFRLKDSKRILYLAANLGHYIADAHVPLHTTENYNGQLTDQHGIHGFWESRIPELFASEWDLLTGQAKYIRNINTETWKIVQESFWAKDSVLNIEKQLTREWGTDRKYVHVNRKRNYSDEFSAEYHRRLNRMVERRLRKAILSVGSYWYTAWSDAGKPDLNKISSELPEDSLKISRDSLKMMKKKIAGHDED